MKSLSVTDSHLQPIVTIQGSTNAIPQRSLSRIFMIPSIFPQSISAQLSTITPLVVHPLISSIFHHLK